MAAHLNPAPTLKQNPAFKSDPEFRGPQLQIPIRRWQRPGLPREPLKNAVCDPPLSPKPALMTHLRIPHQSTPRKALRGNTD
jgi:hypothetical protein